MTRHRIFPVVLLCALFLMHLRPVAQVQEVSLRGKVLEAVSRHGIAALSVNLIASRKLGQPQRLTSTDQHGVFIFTGLTRGRYLLEVSQGVTLLHREVLSIEADTAKEITLRKKQRPGE